MVKGIGTDIIDIPRVKRSITNEHFLKRVYTPGEIAYCNSRGGQVASSFAGIFSAKEAVLKAYGTGLRYGNLTDIEILPDELGCPKVRVQGWFKEQMEQLGADVLMVSISHSKEYATATCILE